MKIFIYQNGMCDEKAGLGGMRKFNKAELVDSFLKEYCGKLPHLAHFQVRIFITNDEVEQHEVDHHALMGDNYGLDLRSNSIKEVNTLVIGAEVNPKTKALLDATLRRTKLERAN